jgi:transcriptional regulator with XRE-family HTH domain
MTQSPPPVRASEVVPLRVRELRKALGWSARQLADELTKAGLEWDRDIVTNFEVGRRRVSIDELMTIAFALNVGLVHLLVPPYPSRGSDAWRPDRPDDNAPYQITPKLVVPIWRVRQFIRGHRPLPGQDPWKFFGEVPPHERLAEDELMRRAIEGDSNA